MCMFVRDFSAALLLLFLLHFWSINRCILKRNTKFYRKIISNRLLLKTMMMLRLFFENIGWGQNVRYVKSMYTSLGCIICPQKNAMLTKHREPITKMPHAFYTIKKVLRECMVHSAQRTLHMSTQYVIVD